MCLNTRCLGHRTEGGHPFHKQLMSFLGYLTDCNWKESNEFWSDPARPFFIFLNAKSHLCQDMQRTSLSCTIATGSHLLLQWLGKDVFPQDFGRATGISVRIIASCGLPYTLNFSYRGIQPSVNPPCFMNRRGYILCHCSS